MHQKFIFSVAKCWSKLVLGSGGGLTLPPVTMTLHAAKISFSALWHNLYSSVNFFLDQLL